MDELVVGIPRRRHDRDRRLERRLGGVWRGIGVGEIVDHLFNAHGIFWRQVARVQGAAREAVGRCIDVNREGGNGLACDLLDRALLFGIELVAVFLLCDGYLLIDDISVRVGGTIDVT